MQLLGFGCIQHNRAYLTSFLLPSPWLSITYSIVQSPSWEANWFAASQEIPRISRKPKVHYRTHKRPPAVSILGQPNPVHIPTSHLLEIHPNIIHPPTPRSPQWSPSIRFPHQDPIHPPLLTLWLLITCNNLVLCQGSICPPCIVGVFLRLCWICNCPLSCRVRT